MGHEFEDALETGVDASVDEVWQAIATGPGIDSWFMGRNSVADGVVHTAFADCTITTSEEGKRFAYTTATQPDGRFVAYDFLIEGRAGGSTSIRLIANGVLPGDDWQDEYFAMTRGHALFFRTLAEYLTFFPQRTATPVTAVGPMIADWPAAWATLAAEIGSARVGDRVTVRGEAGTVYFVNEHTLGVRTADALYRFVRGLPGPMLAMHHLFSEDADAEGVDAAAAEESWKCWLDRVFTQQADSR